ncbi:WYL domain-containing protein [Micrococcaceae bacterium Sec5.7]
MNRTDRLYAIREELRRSGGMGRTAEQLAEAFEISVRTVKRDISALQHSGFPVWARLGRIGGYVVDAAATLPPVNITAAEATALTAALASHRGQPFYAEGQAALVKILAVMDDSARVRSARLAARIWINDDDTRTQTGRVLPTIERAIQDRRIITLSYRDKNGTVTSRRIDPQLLARTDDHWHLVAHCQLRHAVRWFRIDRIVNATLTTETAQDLPLTDLGHPPATAQPLSIQRIPANDNGTSPDR